MDVFVHSVVAFGLFFRRGVDGFCFFGVEAGGRLALGTGSGRVRFDVVQNQPAAQQVVGADLDRQFVCFEPVDFKVVRVGQFKAFDRHHAFGEAQRSAGDVDGGAVERLQAAGQFVANESVVEQHRADPDQRHQPEGEDHADRADDLALLFKPFVHSLELAAEDKPREDLDPALLAPGLKFFGVFIQIQQFASDRLDAAHDAEAQDQPDQRPKDKASGRHVILQAEEGQDRRVDQGFEGAAERPIQQGFADGVAEGHRYQRQQLGQAAVQRRQVEIGVENDDADRQGHGQPPGGAQRGDEPGHGAEDAGEKQLRGRGLAQKKLAEFTRGKHGLVPPKKGKPYCKPKTVC